MYRCLTKGLVVLRYLVVQFAGCSILYFLGERVHMPAFTRSGMESLHLVSRIIFIPILDDSVFGNEVQ